jgi:hypothetical protein
MERVEKPGKTRGSGRWPAGVEIKHAGVKEKI